MNFNVDKVKIISEEITEMDKERMEDNNEKEETKYKLFSVNCVACQYASYSIGRGSISLQELSKTVPPNNLPTIQTVTCEPCPTGEFLTHTYSHSCIYMRFQPCDLDKRFELNLS